MKTIKIKKSSISVLDAMFFITFILVALVFNTAHIKEGFQVLLFLLLISRKRNNWRINNDIAFRFLFTFWCGMSILWATYTSASIDRTLSVIQTFLLFCIGMEYVRSKEDIKKILNLLVFTASLYTIIILATYPIGQILRGTISSEERIRAFNINPNIVGIFLVYGAMALLQYIEDYKHKLIPAVLSVIFIMFAFLTGSKKAFFTCIIGVFLILLMKSKGVTKWIRNLFIAVFALASIVYLCFNVEFLYTTIGYRLETLMNYMMGNSTFADDKSTWGRSYLIEWAREAFRSHPIFGIGIGNFQYTNSFHKYAHNNYWELLANVGIVGFLLYYIPLFRQLYVALKIRFKSKDCSINFALIMLVTIIINDYANMTYTNELLTIIIGAIFSYINISSRTLESTK